MQKFSKVTKAAVEQQRTWSSLRHLELLTKFGRGTKKVEEHVVKALAPVEDKAVARKVVKQVMQTKVLDAKREVEKVSI